MPGESHTPSAHARRSAAEAAHVEPARNFLSGIDGLGDTFVTFDRSIGLSVPESCDPTGRLLVPLCLSREQRRSLKSGVRRKGDPNDSAVLGGHYP
jgi:hypothetical protein